MNIKITIVLLLGFISVLNNLIIYFDTVQEITEDVDKEAFFIENGSSNDFKGYVKMIWQYIVYFIYFYDFDKPISVLELIGYGG